MNSLEDTLSQLHRTETGRLISVLTRIFGPHNHELAEDVVQEAFSKAFRSWQESGIPDNPSAWLLTAARNRAIDVIRRERRAKTFSDDLTKLLDSEWSMTATVDEQFTEGNIRDDQLRMIFMCCAPEIAEENRLPIILRTLCGLSIPAIAKALLQEESTINKRLYRTRQRMAGLSFEFPDEERLPPALQTVHHVIYLLFNEGYHSSTDAAISEDFCREALRLCDLLEEGGVADADTFGLGALMRFHFARFRSRVDGFGNPIGLDEQDRTLWDRERIEDGRRWLGQVTTAPPGASGRYGIEAAIAGTHCAAESFNKTDWATITQLYSRLVDVTGSPIARLNQCVAVGYHRGPAAAIPAVEELCREHETHAAAHSFLAVLAHLYARAGETSRAWEVAERALAGARTEHERSLLRRQITNLVGSPTTSREEAP